MDGPGGLPPAPPLLPKGIGDILNAAFGMYKENWMQFAKIVAVVAIPVSFIQAFAQDQFFTSKAVHIVTNQATGQVTIDTGSGFGRAIGTAILLGLLGGLVYQVMAGAIARAAASSVVGLPVDIDASYRFGLARLGSILLIGLLVGLSVGVGLIFLVIPGLFLAVKFAVSIPTLVVENKRGTKAMSRSWELTGGHFWHVVGTFLVAFIIAGIVSAVLTAPFSGGWFLRAIGSSIAQIVTAPFTAIVTILIYLDLRARKENLSSDGLRAELASSGA